MHLLHNHSPGVFEDEGMGEVWENAALLRVVRIRVVVLRVAPLHQGGYHVKQVIPGFFQFYGPKAGPEDQWPYGVAYQWA